MLTNLQIYIDFNWENYIDDPNGYIKNLARVVDFVYQYGFDVYYCHEHLREFITHCTDLDNEFTASQSNLLDILLENAIKKQSDTYLFEIIFAQENSTLNFISKYSSDGYKPYLGIASLGKNNTTNKILAITGEDCNFVDFKYLGSKQDVLNWINSIWVDRQFNKSQKHGENGVGNWPGESVLMCSRTHAQNLLANAIPDFRKKKARLFNFDGDHNAYIEFFYEGNMPSNQWHGFHVDISEVTKRIPDSIRQFFNR